MRAMRSRWLGAIVVPGSAILSACGGEPVGPGAGPTLPPIVTTSTTTSTTLAPLDDMQEYYEVQRGDTLTEIAVAFRVPVQAIMELNGMTDPDDLFAGQILQLPSPDIVARQLPPTVPGQTAPTLPGGTRPGATTSSTVPGTSVP